MATMQDMERALVNAHNAGDVEAARTLAAAIERARQSPANLIPGATVPEAMPQTPAPSIGQRIVGAGEAALTLATGAAGGTVGMLAGTAGGLARSILSGRFGTPEAVRTVEQAAQRGAQALTYAPRTETGREMAQAVGQTLGEVLPPVLPIIAAPGALLTSAAQQAPLAAATAGRAAAAAPQIARAAVQAPVQAGRALGQRVGLIEPAAPAQPTPAARPFGAVGAEATDAAARRAEVAQSLPVPVTMTRGAATRDEEQLAFERAQAMTELGQPLRNRATENNLQILGNMDALVDMTAAQAPDLTATGGAVTRALASGYQAEKNRVNVLYNRARNSEEARAPVNPDAIVRIGDGDNAMETSLIGYLNSRVSGVPSAAVTDSARRWALQLGIARERADGTLEALPTTVGQMEQFRKELSGMAKFDDRVGLREETILKKLVDAQTEPVSGDLFRQARSARAQMARKYENRAIVARLLENVRSMDDPRVPADQVFRRSILGSSPEEITFLRRVLVTSGEDGKQAWRELQGAFARHLRDEATKGVRMDVNDNPVVSPAQFHQAVRQFDANGRLDIMLGKKNAQTVRDLDDVIRYVNTLPPNTLVNTSGTTETLMRKITAMTAESGAQFMVSGFPVPIVTIAQQIRRARRDAKNRRELEAKINDALNAIPIDQPGRQP